MDKYVHVKKVYEYFYSERIGLSFFFMKNDRFFPLYQFLYDET